MSDSRKGECKVSETVAVAKPKNVKLKFVATEYRVPFAGEYFWSDGDKHPTVCRMYPGMDISYHNGGKRWILVEKK